MTHVYQENKEMVHILDVNMYNPKRDSEDFQDRNIYTLEHILGVKYYYTVWIILFISCTILNPIVPMWV